MSEVTGKTTSKQTSEDAANEGYPAVPEAAIVRPEDERPLKSQMRPEENIEETDANTDTASSGSEDLDGDGSPDWDPAVGPGV